MMLDTTQRPWVYERPSKDKEVDQVISMIDGNPPQRVVNIVAPVKHGKSTFMRQLESKLRSQGRTFHSFDARNLDPNGTTNGIYAIECQIAKIKDLIRENDSPLLLMDSGDSLIQKIDFFIPRPAKVSAVKRLLGQYDKLDRVNYEIYAARDSLLQTLNNPKLQIVTTSHSDWDLHAKENILRVAWENLFPKQSEFRLG